MSLLEALGIRRQIDLEDRWEVKAQDVNPYTPPAKPPVLKQALSKTEYIMQDVRCMTYSEMKNLAYLVLREQPSHRGMLEDDPNYTIPMGDVFQMTEMLEAFANGQPRKKDIVDQS